MRLVYFSPVFARSYAQRPHFAVRAWLRRGIQSVLWVNPYPARLPQWQDLRWRRRIHDQGTPLDARITVLDVPSLPVEPLPYGAWLNRRLVWQGAWWKLVRFAAQRPWILGVGRPGALALMALRELRPTASFYDAMDNFPEFHRGLSRRAMQRCENALAAEVDLVVASSTFLAGKFRRRGLRVVKVLNGCSPAPLPDRETDGRRDPVLGYLGCMGQWFDWPLVVRLAQQLPGVRVELVGPCTGSPPAGLPPNVCLLPPCAQTQTAGYLARFGAGLIPFLRNSLTAAVDPIKFYEYRAAGLPVLSTTFGEMALRSAQDGVYFLDRTEDLPSVVNQALSRRFNRIETEQFRREHDWRQRFQDGDPFGSLFSLTTLAPAA
jgi:glycosyltransferase involved in cell wall biosynthesis